MKVYVVMEGFDYEGYSSPAAVFGSLDAAKAFATGKTKARHPADGVDVFEMGVDEAGAKMVHRETRKSRR